MDFIPVNEPSLNGNEKQYLLDCIDTGWISSEGPYIKKFEDSLALFFGRKYGIAVSNGTVAIDIAVEVLDLQEGDEIILPTFTIISCISAIVRLGLKPVLVDSDPITWNMDVAKIEEKITSRTKAIMVVHIYGLPVDMEPVINLSKKYNLKIIEDAAEMHGQEYNGKKCGSFGLISTVSFYPNKHITTGEGGMIFTDDAILAERCRSFRNLCFVPEKRFIHYELGYNYRMTNLQAALGVAQLERIDQFIHRKREIGRLYTEQLKNISNVNLPLKETAYASNIYWVFGIVLDKDLGIDAELVMKEYAKNKIGTRPFFWCMHEQPVLKKRGLFEGESYPIAENMSRQGFYLPSGLGISNEQLNKVIEITFKIFKNYGCI
jgi:perosamine synthetase